MALQDLRPAALGQALRPNIWDAVALIFVIGAALALIQWLYDLGTQVSG